ncbi:MAG: pyridoxal-phosphate dependent enzyme [Halodesulfurarchaeum sp.]
MAGEQGPFGPDLVCRACGRTYPPGPGEPWRCECGHALDFDPGLDRDPPPVPENPPERLDRDRGLWAFEAFLPIPRQVTLGEGFTPLVQAPNWEASFKLEYVFPSGSFKDRGATTTISRAAALGVERVVEDSSGNAGAAIAQYAARAGIEARIYVPEGVKPSKLAAIERTGADPVRVSGDRSAVTAACLEAVEDGEGWYASHAWNPAFYAGTATVAMEIAAQRGWSAPDAMVFPVGHGTLFLGAYRGFAALLEAGWIDSMPRLLGVQAAGVAPVVAAVGAGAASESAVSDADGRNDLADGIQIEEPARLAQLQEAVTATDGAVIPIDEEATHRALDALHRAGFHVEPTSAVAVAGLEAYRERGAIAPDADVVVPLTGSGLKMDVQ